MLTRKTSVFLLAAGCLGAITGVWAWAQGTEKAMGQKLDTARIEQIMGTKGTWDEQEGVLKIGLPRNDIAATVTGVKMSVPMGLGGWAAFKKVGDPEW